MILVDIPLIIFFKTLNFVDSLFIKAARRYDKLRIQQTCRSFQEPLNVKNQKSFVTRNTILGKNINFNGLKIYGGGEVVIGDNFHSGTGCVFITEVHNYDLGKAIPYDDSYIVKSIRIENNVWIGQDVMILGGVTIGEGAIIQAGSVVVKSIPKCAIAGGHPAKVFSYRNIERYEKLKASGSFH